jgi:tetratricopeptide (TPR) repeat protein
MGPAGLGEARGLLERAVLLDSGYALARAALGGARAMGYVATGDPADLDAAVAHLARAVELDPRLGEPHAWLCYCRARQGRFAEAAEAGRRAVELDPGGFYGPYFLGAALWMEGSEAFRPGVWREADHALARAASNLPRAPTTFLVLADVRLRCGRYDLAVEAARRGAELEESGRVEGPRILGSHAALGTALLKAGREEEASRVLATSAERLSGLDHVYVPAYLATTRLGEAEIALRQGRADLAYARCREVVEAWRDGARRLGLGWLAVRGHLALAVAAHLLLLARERDAALEEGLGILRSAAGLGFGTIFQGGPAVAWMDAGRALARLGRDDEAYDAVLQAVEAGWSDPVALETDPALESLRARPEVGHLLAVVAERSRLDA